MIYLDTRNMEKEFDLNDPALRATVLKQLRSGQSILGKGGALAPLLKIFLDSALEGEMDAHMDSQERQSGNRRNGKTTKSLKTSLGSVDICVPRDRSGSFDPEIVKKRERVLADSLEERILGLYGLGMSFRDISKHIQEMYDTEISHATLSSITDRVIPAMQEWQNRTLDPLYTVVWMDAMHYKVKEGSRVQTRAVYNILGIKRDGCKELLGMYVSESEGAAFWLSVLTHLQNRGVQDILITCIDNLKGFAEAVESIFPRTEIQTCIVHQIRNSFKYIGEKHKREFLTDLKTVYQANSEPQAYACLDALSQKWADKYSLVIDSWYRNWSKLSTYFKYDPEIRKMIYTTNTIEGLHRQFRKVSKNKGAFPNDEALLKLLYLAHKDISRKWTAPLTNWKQIAQRLCIWFPDRMFLDLS